MNVHVKNALRFATVVFWFMTVGVIYTLITGCANCWALGWFGILLYASILVAVLYGAAVATHKIWRLK